MKSDKHSSVAPVAQKIMLIRHAEKPPPDPPPHGIDSGGDHDKDSLIVRGWQRAGALCVLFAPTTGPLKYPELATPGFIYASNVESHSDSKRPQETVIPLVGKLGSRNVTANFEFAKGQEKELAAAVQACNAPVLVCWEHHNIPQITKHFPISTNNKTPVPADWPDDRFDLIWVFDQDSTGSYCFSELPQMLLSGDRPV